VGYLFQNWSKIPRGGGGGFRQETPCLISFRQQEKSSKNAT